MTHTTFAELQKRMIASINDTSGKLETQLGIAKGHYRMACEEYGSHSEQAGKWDKIVCALQVATEALSDI